jgi:hypothetical protein
MARPVTATDRATTSLNISRNGGVYAELAELELTARFHPASSRMMTLALYRMPLITESNYRPALLGADSDGR